MCVVGFLLNVLNLGRLSPYWTDYTPESLSITRFSDVLYKTHNKKLYVKGNKT